MSTYDLTGTVYKILPEVFAEVFTWPISDVRAELGSEGEGFDGDELRGRLAARKAHKIAAAMVAELSRIHFEYEAPVAPRTGRRGERAA